MNKQELENTIRAQQGAWMGLGMRFFGNESDAQDALQETLLKLWLVRERLKTAGDAAALGTRIMKNECVNLHRQRQHIAVSPPPDAPTLESSPHMRMEEDEHRAMLQWAVGHLPLNARSVLQLHLYEEMTLDEISARTGKTKGAVKTMITRAKQQITTWLKTKS